MRFLRQARRTSWYIVSALVISILFTELLHAKDAQHKANFNSAEWQCTLAQEQQSTGMATALLSGTHKLNSKQLQCGAQR